MHKITHRYAFNWLRDYTVGGALLGRVLSEFYKSVEKLGFVAGGEFKAAVEEGEEHNRDVNMFVRVLLERLT